MKGHWSQQLEQENLRIQRFQYFYKFLALPILSHVDYIINAAFLRCKDFVINVAKRIRHWMHVTRLLIGQPSLCISRLSWQSKSRLISSWRVKASFCQKRYGLDQWAAAPLQRLANQWVAWGGIDSIQTSAGIFKQSMGARNRVEIGFSYRPARLRRLAELIPWNWFLGSLKV